MACHSFRCKAVGLGLGQTGTACLGRSVRPRKAEQDNARPRSQLHNPQANQSRTA